MTRANEIYITRELYWKLARIAKARNGGDDKVTVDSIVCEILQAAIDQKFPQLHEFWKARMEAEDNAVKAIKL